MGEGSNHGMLDMRHRRVIFLLDTVTYTGYTIYSTAPSVDRSLIFNGYLILGLFFLNVYLSHSHAAIEETGTSSSSTCSVLCPSPAVI